MVDAAEGVREQTSATATCSICSASARSPSRSTRWTWSTSTAALRHGRRARSPSTWQSWASSPPSSCRSRRARRRQHRQALGQDALVRRPDACWSRSTACSRSRRRSTSRCASRCRTSTSSTTGGSSPAVSRSGVLRVGDSLLFSPSNKTATGALDRGLEPRTEAGLRRSAGQSVGITLDQQVFVERGEIASHEFNPPNLSNVFRTTSVLARPRSRSASATASG